MIILFKNQLIQFLEGGTVVFYFSLTLELLDPTCILHPPDCVVDVLATSFSFFTFSQSTWMSICIPFLSVYSHKERIEMPGGPLVLVFYF